MTTLHGARAIVATLLAILLSLPAAHTLHAEPTGTSTPLDIALVDSPAINCRFAPSCSLIVQADDLDEIPLAGTNGLGRLQTRLFAAGEPGTAAAGLYPFLYRFNFFEVAVTTPPVECIASLALPFGEIAPVDYDDDGEPDDLFIVQGTSGAPILSSAEQLADGTISLVLATPLCPGAPGSEGGSYFIGLAAELPPLAGKAVVGVAGAGGGAGENYEVQTLVPTRARILLPVIEGQ